MATPRCAQGDGRDTYLRKCVSWIDGMFSISCKYRLKISYESFTEHLRPVIPMSTEEVNFVKTEFTAGHRLIDIRRCADNNEVWCRRTANGYDSPYDTSVIEWVS